MSHMLVLKANLTVIDFDPKYIEASHAPKNNKYAFTYGSFGIIM